jgi:hypothetical protein
MAIKVFRSFLGYVYAAPFALMAYSLMPFIGKKRAVGRVGKWLTKTTVFCLRLLIPTISAPSEFDAFKMRIMRNFMLLAPLYDLKIADNTANHIEFNVHHCVVTHAFKTLGLSDICKYACAADWVVAKRNQDHWEFARRQTIGTGGPFCNHTYKRKISS